MYIIVITYSVIHEQVCLLKYNSYFFPLASGRSDHYTATH